MRFTILYMLLLVSAAVQAQEHTISLDKSKEAALEHSKAIRNGSLNVESAEAGVKAARSAYTPNVSVTGVGVYSFKDIISAMPPLLERDINNFYFGGATLIQPLYAGGKIRTSNQLATLQLEVSKIRARQSVDSVLLVTEQKYWNLVDLQEQYKVILANERLLDSLLKQQNDLLASGLIARNDLLKVKVQRSRLLLNKSKLENGRKLALMDFCFYIGLPYDSRMVMEDTLTGQASLTVLSSTPDTSLTGNDNYLLLQKSLEGARLQTKLAKGDLKPTVSVGLSAAQSGVIGHGGGGTFVPATIGIVSVPISELWGQGKQKVKQHAIIEKMTENNVEDAENLLKLGIMQAWYGLTDAIKQIGFAEENLQQATENLRVSQDNYASGLAGVTELMDAQASYQEASSALISAYSNYQLNTAIYRFVSGHKESR